MQDYGDVILENMSINQTYQLVENLLLLGTVTKGLKTQMCIIMKVFFINKLVNGNWSERSTIQGQRNWLSTFKLAERDYPNCTTQSNS